MDANKILADLETERQRIDEAILAIRRLAIGGQRRRGRPPRWYNEFNEVRRGRPPGSKNRPKPIMSAGSQKAKDVVA